MLHESHCQIHLQSVSHPATGEFKGIFGDTLEQHMVKQGKGIDFHVFHGS